MIAQDPKCGIRRKGWDKAKQEKEYAGVWMKRTGCMWTLTSLLFLFLFFSEHGDEAMQLSKGLDFGGSKGRAQTSSNIRFRHSHSKVTFMVGCNSALRGGRADGLFDRTSILTCWRQFGKEAGMYLCIKVLAIDAWKRWKGRVACSMLWWCAATSGDEFFLRARENFFYA